MALVKCPDCGRECSDAAPACPQCGRPQTTSKAPTAPASDRKAGTIGCFTVVLLLAAIGLVVERCGPDDEPDAAAAPVAAPEVAQSYTPPECRLSLPGSTEDVPVMPTEEGLDEYVRASATSAAAAQIAFDANGGFVVRAKTRCSYIDAGLMQTRVRIIEGTRIGQAGWLPTEWTRGD